MPPDNSSTTPPGVPAKPVPAATVLLLRDGAGGLEVFMVKRHGRSSAFAGALVFPGGTVEQQDILGDEITPFGAPLRRAAIRELFEETGFILAHDRSTNVHLSPEHAAWLVGQHREATRCNTLDFWTMLNQEQLQPAIDSFVPLARWITPGGARKRYDTYFFAAAAIEGQFGMHDGSELVESVWLTPRAAIDAGDAGSYKVLFPTRSQLLLLAPHRTVADALAAAAARVIVTVEPVVIKTEGQVKLCISADAGYPETEFFQPLQH